MSALRDCALARGGKFSDAKSGDNFTREVVAALLLTICYRLVGVRLAAVCAVTFGTATRLFEGRGRYLDREGIGLLPRLFRSAARVGAGARYV